MFKKFSHYFRSSSDENRLLNVVLLILFGLSSLIAAYDAIFYKSLIYIFSGVLALVSLGSVVFLYFDKITYRSVSRTIVAILFILLLAGFIFTEDAISATMYLIGFPVVLIALRPDNEWAISIFAFILVMAFCQIFAFTAVSFTWEELTMVWLTLGMVSIFLGYYVLMSRATKDTLAVEQAKLSNMNNELESQVAARTKELQEANAQLALDITLDPVTGIMNKRTFMEKLRTHIERFKFDKTRFSIILFDLDDFYQVNHGHGRRVGDEILAKIAALTVKNSLTVDIVARVAGDEFAVLMHDKSYQDAVERANKIREHIEWAIFVDNYQITASFGVVEFNEKRGDFDEHIVMHELDLALQKAKHRGKNMVC